MDHFERMREPLTALTFDEIPKLSSGLRQRVADVECVTCIGRGLTECTFESTRFPFDVCNV